MKLFIKILKISGIIILGTGVILQFLDLNCFFIDKDKAYVVEWASNSKVGLSIEHPGAKKFCKAFPLPSDAPQKEITHLTKQIINSSLGGKSMMVSVNYMYSDTSRSSYVANLEEIKEWATKTPYPWIAWTFSFIGFLEVALSYFLERKIMNA